MDIEQIRNQNRPSRIHTLFVGESAPVSGKFFYVGNTQMARYMSRAFGDPPDFLTWFRDRGFYLDDLVLTPINHWTEQQRRQAHKSSIFSLSHRIIDYRPLAIVTVLLKIDPCVREAIRQAEWKGRYFAVAFPGNGQQKRFLSEMLKLVDVLPSTDHHTPVASRTKKPIDFGKSKPKSTKAALTEFEEVELRQIMREFGISIEDIRGIGKVVRRRLRKRFPQHQKWSRWVFIRGSDEYNEVLRILSRQGQR